MDAIDGIVEYIKSTEEEKQPSKLSALTKNAKYTVPDNSPDALAYRARVRENQAEWEKQGHDFYRAHLLKEMYTVAQVAAEARVSVGKVRYAIKKGRIEVVLIDGTQFIQEIEAKRWVSRYLNVIPKLA